MTEWLSLTYLPGHLRVNHCLRIQYNETFFNGSTAPYFVRLWSLLVVIGVPAFLSIPPSFHSSVGKESTCNAGEPGLIPGSGRSAGEVC